MKSYSQCEVRWWGWLLTHSLDTSAHCLVSISVHRTRPPFSSRTVLTNTDSDISHMSNLGQAGALHLFKSQVPTTSWSWGIHIFCFFRFPFSGHETLLSAQCSTLPSLSWPYALSRAFTARSSTLPPLLQPFTLWVKRPVLLLTNHSTYHTTLSLKELCVNYYRHLEPIIYSFHV